jgi:hypothetical protein
MDEEKEEDGLKMTFELSISGYLYYLCPACPRPLLHISGWFVL